MEVSTLGGTLCCVERIFHVSKNPCISVPHCHRVARSANCRRLIPFHVMVVRNNGRTKHSRNHEESCRKRGRSGPTPLVCLDVRAINSHPRKPSRRRETETVSRKAKAAAAAAAPSRSADPARAPQRLPPSLPRQIKVNLNPSHL